MARKKPEAAAADGQQTIDDGTTPPVLTAPVIPAPAPDATPKNKNGTSSVPAVIIIEPALTFKAEVLTPEESQERAVIEDRMEKSRDIAIKHGNKFMEDLELIRKKRLYRDHPEGFTGYCKDRFSITPNYLRRIEFFGKTVQAIAEYKEATGQDVEVPATEGAMRPLSQLGDALPEVRVQVARRAQEIAKARGAKHVTAGDMQSAVDEHLGKKADAAAPYDGQAAAGVTASDTAGMAPANLADQGTTPDTLFIGMADLRQYAIATYAAAPDAPVHTFKVEYVTGNEATGNTFQLYIDDVEDINNPDLQGVILARINAFCRRLRLAYLSPDARGETSGFDAADGGDLSDGYDPNDGEKSDDNEYIDPDVEDDDEENDEEDAEGGEE